MKKLIKHLLTLTALIGLAAPHAQAEDPLKIAYPNWAEGIAMTHLINAVLQDEMGVETKLTQADPGAIYTALANGSQDFMVDGWLPNTHQPYWEKHGDKLEDLGPNFGYGITGLVVPTYLKINSITELNSLKEKLDGKIIGIGSGAGIYRNTNKAIEEYNLDLKQVASSGPAMTAALGKAIKDEKPIVVTGWKPHWKFARYDLKVLEDPKGIYPIDGCKTIARKGFRKEHPEIAQLLTNFSLTENQLLDLMLKIDEAKGDQDAAEVARQWKKENMALVESWLPMD